MTRPAAFLLLLFALAIGWGARSAAVLAQPQPAQASSGSTTAPAAPQAAPKSFLPPRAGGAKDAASPPPPSGLFGGLYYWIADKQRQFIATLAAALRDIKGGNALAASLVLIGFSFAYGILHAAGPGHGKAIVSSYILADGQTVRRGVQLAFMSAFVQALSAIAIFAVVVLMMKGARTQIAYTEAWIERMSWLLVAAFGAWLLVRQLRGLIRGASAHAHHAHHGHHGHDLAHGQHGHHHSHAHHAHDHGHAQHKPDHGHGHTHAHDHTHLALFNNVKLKSCKVSIV